MPPASKWSSKTLFRHPAMDSTCGSLKIIGLCKDSSPLTWGCKKGSPLNKILNTEKIEIVLRGCKNSGVTLMSKFSTTGQTGVPLGV